MDMTINNTCWKQMNAPWKKTSSEAVAVAAGA
jgi:hypothetical protein